MGETLEIDAADDMWLIEYAPDGVKIESDLGYYDLGSPLLGENQDKHSRIFRITNRDSEVRTASFVVAIAK